MLAVGLGKPFPDVDFLKFFLHWAGAARYNKNFRGVFRTAVPSGRPFSISKEFSMAKQQRTIGVFIIQLALAIYLVITGLCLFGVGGSISSSEIQGVASFFKGGAKVVEYIIAILLIACGVVFLLKAFGLDFGKADDLIKYITLVVWIVVTVVTLISLIGELSSIKVLHWLLVLAKNALIVGGILTIKNGR